MMPRRHGVVLCTFTVFLTLLPASLCSWTKTSPLVLRNSLSGSTHVSARLHIPLSVPRSLRLKGGGPAAPGRKVLDEYSHEIKSQKNEARQGSIRIEVAKLPDKSIECTMTSSIPGAVWLHWGFATRGGGWVAPPDQFLPPGTKKIDDKAVQSQFKDGKIVVTVPEKQAPEALAFVVKCDSPEEWFNGPGGDFWVDFKPMDPDSIGNLIIDREVSSTHWSILERMRLVNENIKAVAESESGLAWIYTLLRFNQMKLVPVSRRSNYQSKDLAHTQDTVSKNIAAVYGRYPSARPYARLCAATVPRGGGNGDAVRLEILDIMRRHGLKEGHRPGIEDHFIEQWHQKLHTNCAPDDLIIVDAYIKFLGTGNLDDYWKHLHGNGLSYEYMQNIGGGKGSANSGLAGMTANPMHLPQLTDDMKHLRWTLMQLHGGQDFDFLLHKASGGLDGELIGILKEIQNNRHEWWIPGKIMEARRKIATYLDNPAGHRDALLLDVWLENWFKVQMDKSNFGQLQGDALIDTVALALENVALSYGEHFWSVLNTFNRLRGEPDKWSERWSRLLKATVERAAIALSSLMDGIYMQVQPKADRLGKALGTDQAYLTNFGEEVVRGMPGYSLSQLLACLEPIARAAAKMGAWELAGAVKKASGTVSVMEDMIGIQGKTFDTPQVLIVTKVGGVEDIPPGVTAILTRSSTDILSHIAIRARNQGVLLATCHDDAQFNALKALSGGVTVSANPTGDVVVSAGASSEVSKDQKKDKGRKIAVKAHTTCDKNVLVDQEFSAQYLGGKSNNLQKVRAASSKLPAFIKLPQSVALPFGTCEKALADPSNAAVKAEVDELVQTLKGNSEDAEILASIRSSIMTMIPPHGLEAELAAACKAVGIPAELTEDIEGCFEAIKGVWASKWGDRAYFSRNAFGVPHASLTMAVLIQKVVHAEYAFVLHTTNPVTGDADEIMGEVVVGLGEALVGNYPGRALGFTVNKKTGDVKILQLPSKHIGIFLKADTLIFRSDSNGEDLEDYAGAGLYESIMANKADERPVDYSQEKLLWDEGFRIALVKKIAEAARAVEEAMGSPQDIEGCVVGDDIHVVQTRPQV